jgi:hypothetical protein
MNDRHSRSRIQRSSRLELGLAATISLLSGRPVGGEVFLLTSPFIELLARPSIELVTVDSATVQKAAQRIESCEYSHPADAEILFDWLLAEVTGKRGPYEFILGELARCPNCKHEITEKTLVEPKD